MESQPSRSRDKTGYISQNPEINVKMLVLLRDMYGELREALERIASGEPDPVAIARQALYGKWEEEEEE